MIGHGQDDWMIPTEALPIITVPALAYYAPWGDVVMFYESFGSAAGLYELGQAVSGSDNIQLMSGVITIVKSSIQ